MDETVDKLQARLNQALLDADGAVLDRLVAPDCQIIGPKGFKIAKDEWIGVHGGGEFEQIRLEVRDAELHRFGATAVRCDILDSACRFRGEVITGQFRVTHVWARQSRTWRLVAIQYTPLAMGGVS